VTDNEYDYSPSGVTSFNSDGFTVNGAYGANYGSTGYVSWCWRAGGNKNTFNIDDVGYSSAAQVKMASGNLDSEVYDQDQVWSNSLTSSSGFRGSEPKTNAFDGNPTTICSAAGQGTITFTSPSAIPGDATIRVIVHGGAHNITVNGGPTQTVSDAGIFVKVNHDNPTNSTLTITFQRVSNADTGIRAIEINGQILTDNGTSPVSVPSLSNTKSSVGTKQGFSIVTWTGTGNNESIAHGLTKAPNLIILKEYNKTADWSVYTTEIDGSYDYLVLNSTGLTNNSSYVNPTDKVFYYSASNNDTLIAYCWHDVPGLQKFGSFEGNDNTDGTYVDLGFKPALVICKNVDTNHTVGGSSAVSWGMWDSARMPRNPAGNPLFANLSTSETVRGNESSANTGGDDANGLGGFLLIDLLSNGFKCRSAGSECNAPGTHLFMAWAEEPNINLYGAQSTAR